MPILETTRLDEIDKSPIGDSFLPENKGTAGRRLRTGLDFYNLGRTVFDICGVVERLKKGSDNHLLEDKLELDIEHITASLGSHNGIWLLGSPRRPIASELFQNALYDSYGITHPGVYSSSQWLCLPPGSVTAAQALVRKSTSQIFEPVIDMRIRTAADVPVEVYNTESCDVQALPSSGHWFRFSLIGLELHLPEVARE